LQRCAGKRVIAMKTKIYVQSIGLFGTGFENWASAKAIFTGQTNYEPTAFVPPSPDWLPPAERRRTSDIIRLAMVAGREALTNANASTSDSATVFSSSGGSGEVIHQICESLASDERDVSPTRFHNSVHNAPAGYWGIAAKNEYPSTSLCGHDASFSVGLLEAVAQAKSQTNAVLLLVHDLPYPEPLNAVRTVHGLCSIALLIHAEQSPQTQCTIEVELEQHAAPESVATKLSGHLAALEPMRLGNPAARGLPLLAAIAQGGTGDVLIANTNQSMLRLRVC
jgi:Beta-ketoacyl synthase, N-terminal domain